MRGIALVFSFAFFLYGFVRAEVSPVGITAPEATAWTGERVKILIELRAMGSFSGVASFDAPEIPGVLFVKVGNPVVGSTEIEGESWFIQTHEFALFSQKSGSVTIPSFPVRFGSRDGFTGPVTEAVVKTEAISVEIKRPPGSEAIPFLVTANALTVEETWDPLPESAKVGDVFRRTIVQKADGLTGMALLPAPVIDLDGIRSYEPQVETSDKTERGNFQGERRETLTYLLQKPGALTLPELTYTWWNPQSETLQSKTLPAVTVQVAAAPSVSEPSAASRRWLIGLVVTGLLFLLFFQRVQISVVLRKMWRILNPPDRVAARHLRRACRRNDALSAQKAWNEWRAVAVGEVIPGSDLQAAVVEMQRTIFGPATNDLWEGEAFLRAFEKVERHKRSSGKASSCSDLPALNRPNAFAAKK